MPPPGTERTATSPPWRRTIVRTAPGLSYRAGVDFATASRSAYVAGPNQYLDATDPDRPSAQLAPVNRLTAFSTLQYEF